MSCKKKDIVVCGHVLGKRWYFDLKLNVELWQSLIKKEMEWRDEINRILGSYPPYRDNPKNIMAAIKQ